MAKVRTHNSDNEAQFDIDELFVTRTDERGVLLAWNQVFRRLSGYPEDRLHGAPHKIVRHNDMPSGMFWLMWDRLKKGLPVGAYVKNRGADGTYYWVFAVVTPVDGGYFSIRLKPTSEMLATLKDLYRELRDAEENEDVSPEDSAKVLIQKLQDMGYKTYDTFMSHALSLECESRNLRLGRQTDEHAKQFDEMIVGLHEIRQQSETIMSGFDAVKTTPMNMRIQAAHLGDLAAPLSVISVNYNILASSIRERIENLLEGIRKVISAIRNGIFLHHSALVQSEGIEQIESEEGGNSIKDEIEYLRDLVGQCRSQAEEAHGTIDREITRFINDTISLKRTMSGLSLTRVIGLIESARIDVETGKMVEIIDQLRRFQSVTEDCLREIETGNRTLKSQVNQQIKSFDRMIAHEKAAQHSQVSNFGGAHMKVAV